MDIILLLLGAWWLSGVLGCRERKARRRRNNSWWKPDMNEYDWEEFNKRNGR